MAHPTQELLRQLRENPDPALVAFIEAQEPGRWLTSTEAWIEYNGLHHFPDGATFRYAWEKAGGEIERHRVRRRPEFDTEPPA